MEKSSTDFLYTRINLDKTNYKVSLPMAVILRPDPNEIREIYFQYCRHKQFKSVPVIHDKEILGEDILVLGYYDQGNLEAFSLFRIFDNENIENFQFAWTYHNPKLRYGIKSLETECALFKAMGYKYMYLGLDAPYKQKIDGFEILGPVQ